MAATFDNTMIEKIRTCDPLHFDTFVHVLPRLNKDKNIQGIVELTRYLIPERHLIEHWSIVESLAALRDFAMLIGSLTRWGISHTDDLEGFTPILKHCGELARHVPVGTIFSYGLWNPEGDRKRRYSPYEAEGHFIDSFKEGSRALSNALEKLLQAKNLSISDPAFVALLQESLAHFEILIKILVEIKKGRITPEMFTENIRPYFDPCWVGNTRYFAASGTQLPLILIDHVLSLSDSNDQRIRAYGEENIAYSPYWYRELWKQDSSLVTRVKEEICSRTLLLSQEQASLEMLIKYLDRIYSFRMVHLAVAQKSFALRPEDAVGSGGYTLDILKLLIQKTVEAQESIRPVPRKQLLTGKAD